MKTRARQQACRSWGEESLRSISGVLTFSALSTLFDAAVDICDLGRGMTFRKQLHVYLGAIAFNAGNECLTRSSLNLS